MTLDWKETTLDVTCEWTAVMPVVSIVPGTTPQTQPVQFGVSFPRGSLRDLPLCGRLVSADGASTPAQFSRLATWPDQSTKWARVDAVLPACESHGQWRVEVGRETHEPDEGLVRNQEGSFSAECGSRLLAVSNGEAESSVSKLALGSRNWLLTDHRGRAHRPILEQPVASLRGPVVLSLEQRGMFRRLGGLRVCVRWTIYPGAGLARCDATLHNARRARHRGGLWDLGDAGSRMFREFSFELDATPGETHTESKSDLLRCRTTTSAGYHDLQNAFSLYQASSGGENYRSDAHQTRDGVVPIRIRGYRAALDGVRQDGLRAEPEVTVGAGDQAVTLAAAEFWQQFPKSVETRSGQLRLGIYPREWGDLHELQGGERKRFTFWLRFHDLQTPPEMDWVYSPVTVVPAADGCAGYQGLGEATEHNTQAFRYFSTVLAEGRTGPSGLLANRERVDEYGWRNFGDTHADHEAAFYTGEAPFVSHYNNQFDVLLGFLLQFIRTRDEGWFRLADELARHVIDIDIYNTIEDRSAYNGGLFWFTDHYLTAHTSTHRTYSRHNAPSSGPYGGGPGPEHNYAEGLLLYHFLTGCPDAGNAVLGLADWVVRMEDGTLADFAILDDGPTGRATLGLAKPSRGGANSISVLVDAWRLSGRRRYLSLAEELLQRCIHPNDDIDKLDLLDAEKNWSYTMFLTSIAKYLFAKEEAKERDYPYQFGRESLLHYARWMADNERPYFDQTDRLEYRTEAWACQELRKANVFRRASRYAPPDLAKRLLSKGDEFGDRAWSDLMQFEGSRMTIRALALVMTEGLFDCVFRHSAPKPLASEALIDSFTPKKDFQDQRTRILANAKTIAGAVTLAARVANPVRWAKLQRRRRAVTTRLQAHP